MGELELPDADSKTIPITAFSAQSPRIGAVFNARRSIFRREIFVVVEDADASVLGIWSDGTTQALKATRLGTAVLPASHDVQSAAGRIRALLENINSQLSIDCLKSLSERWRDMVQVPGNVVGVLLDRESLGLSLTSALDLPIEDWRVRYEFLRGSADSRERFDLATLIVKDTSAPRGVRVRVAIAEELDLALVDSDAALVFATLDATPATLARIATDLIESNSTEAVQLRQSTTAPEMVAKVSNAATALAELGGMATDFAKAIEVVGLPTSIIDDLIDRRVRRFDLAKIPRSIVVDGVPALPLHTYIRGRIAPLTLSAEEVVLLKFASEAYRRYIAGEDEVGQAMGESQLNDARVARSLKGGEIPESAPTDTLLAELFLLLGPEANHSPSESLLNDLSVWPTLIDHGIEGNVLASGVGATFADVSALHKARRALFEWEWETASLHARRRLRGSKNEAARDELLNIMACALWLQDQPAPALAALDSALEGQYSDALLANAAVVASELEPSEAVDRFVRLALEAPNPQQRAMAAERALLLWQNDEAQIWKDGDETIPREIIDALRPLIGQPVSDDRYRRILTVLASNDDEWLSVQPAAAFGSYADSPAVRVYMARAIGIVEFVAALGKELKMADHEKWLAVERDNLISTAVSVLIDDDRDVLAAFFGMSLIEGKMPMTPSQRVPLVCLTVTAVAQNIDTNEGEPKDVFVAWVSTAQQETARMEEGDRETFKPLVAMAGDALARSYARSRHRQLEDASKVFDQASSYIRTLPSQQINHQAVQEIMVPISQLCRDSWEVLRNVRPLIRDPELLEAVDAVMRFATDLGNRAVDVR